MKTLIAATAVLLAVGCGQPAEPEPSPRRDASEFAPPSTPPRPAPSKAASPEAERNLQPLEEALAFHLAGRDLRYYIVGIEAGGGNRVRVLTQLEESQTEEADAICNITTVAAYGLDDIEVSGVDVAAAGGRNIAHCEPRV